MLLCGIFGQNDILAWEHMYDTTYKARLLDVAAVDQQWISARMTLFAPAAEMIASFNNHQGRDASLLSSVIIFSQHASNITTKPLFETSGHHQQSSPAKKMLFTCVLSVLTVHCAQMESAFAQSSP